MSAPTAAEQAITAYRNATNDARKDYEKTLAANPSVRVAREKYENDLAVARATYFAATRISVTP